MRATPAPPAPALIGEGYSPTWSGWGLQWNNADSTPAPAQFRQYARAAAFCFLFAGVWYIWCVSLINTIVTDGYPQLGTAPSTYLSNRYGLNWACIFILSMNGWLPMLLAYALLNNKDDTWRNLHDFFSKILILGNLLVFLILTGVWAFDCNASFTGAESTMNDYRWCGVFWPSPWCPNNGPFTPAVASGDLVRNFEGYMHWVFSMVFFVTACWNFSWNTRLAAEGVLE